MNKKDYILIAKHLNNGYNKINKNDSYEIYAYIIAVNSVINALSEDNYSFDKERFNNAVYEDE